MKGKPENLRVSLKGFRIRFLSDQGSNLRAPGINHTLTPSSTFQNSVSFHVEVYLGLKFRKKGELRDG